MAFNLHDITNALSSARTGIAVASSLGVIVPPALVEYEAKATAFLAAIEGVQVPHDLNEAVGTVEHIAGALNDLGVRVNVSQIVKAGRAVAATEHNLKTGQAAVLAIMEDHFDDGADKVTIVAYRGRGTFADLVNQGVTDANDLTPQG